MTNRSTNCRNVPFLLKPVGKDYLWGGNRLNRDFAKAIDMEPLAETWECSTHPEGTSVIAGGEFTGQLLSRVLKEHPEFIGTHPHTKEELPILIKFIDAAKDLSVQVHPDDDYAFRYENGSLGKTEMWYVLDAAPGAKLVYGFRRDMDADVLRRSVETGTIEKYLKKVPIRKDDVFFIEAGTVHAIGAGALIVEIQQSSNLTYRLYDYKRLDKQGNTRPLHIDKALAVANLHACNDPRQPMRLLRYQRGCAREFLCRCKYFQVERLLLNTTIHEEYVPFQTGENSFQVLLCTEGSGVIKVNKPTDDSCESMSLAFSKGDCVFVPASSAVLQLNGKAQLLNVGC